MLIWNYATGHNYESGPSAYHEDQVVERNEVIAQFRIFHDIQWVHSRIEESEIETGVPQKIEKIKRLEATKKFQVIKKLEATNN